MKKLNLDMTFLEGFVSSKEMSFMESQINDAHEKLKKGSGPGSEYIGWLDLPSKFDKNEFNRIRLVSERIRKNSEVVVVIGIGGSYLGARAAIEFLGHSFSNQIANKKGNPEIYFAGINLSSRYIIDLIEVIGDRDFTLVVISKSGTTTEPAISFRLLKKHLIKKYGEDNCSDRIIAITDKERGALKSLASQQHYETFIVPDDVGGRFSVLTPVGLLPIACSGVDISELMNGARDAMYDFQGPLDRNICSQYAAIRNILYNKGKLVEMLVSYEPGMISLTEWWKQLYGESEGKDGKGIFPASASFTMDLHSMGQYIQDGRRHIFETLIEVEQDNYKIEMSEDNQNLDGLNYLSGKTLDYINKKAAEGTIMAHVEGGVPIIIIRVPEFSAYYLGYLIYFFEKACAISGYLLGVNPFDQPGVEFYKSNMFSLLGKPGYDK